MAGHVIADRHLELAVGLLVLAAGAWLCHDACEGRGVAQPAWMRPFSFW